MIGIVGWAIILGAWAVWEAIGLLHAHDPWPTMSDMLRAASRPLFGRWALFALWLWLGWHLFIRGWTSFLVGAPPNGNNPAAGAAGGSLSHLLREDILPLVAIYTGLVGAFVVYGRRMLRLKPAPEGTAGPDVSGGEGLRYVATTIGGGYVSFLIAITLFYAVVGGQQRSFLEQATWQGALLAFAVAAPFFAVTPVVGRGIRRFRRRRARSEH